jgi:hypothetical protein
VEHKTVQPILRYRYLVSTLLIFAACDGMARLAVYFLRNSADSEHDNSIQAPGA